MVFLILYFFNRQAEVVAQAIGEQPRSILENNLAALVAGKNVPHAPADRRIISVCPQKPPPQMTHPERTELS